ncbi:hypothetical protein HGRIS_011556 [Hohenbuehelia grisea]|uniref:Macrofage activating glycoprotein n=1 Tax=Hohenbuehelia grisea TaxID=104357 RepID=A0ABR3JX73_9AGAR
MMLNYKGMMAPSLLIASFVLLIGTSVRAQYSATYLPSNAPKTTENGQTGTNQCGTTASQNSSCQNAYINSVEDFCLWGPPEPNHAVGNDERIVVAWCMKDGTGSRLIPDGTIQGAHFVQTPDFIQITGVGDLTKINVLKGDEGGELDPHGADGNGNPVGGLVFSTAFGALQQVHEWTQFVSDTQFCFRACTGNRATQFCEHIYDVMGCNWNMPASYDAGTFENCKGDSGEPMGLYGGSKFQQGQPVTPPAHHIPSSSSCSKFTSIGNGAVVVAGSSTATSSAANTASVSTTKGSASQTSPPGSTRPTTGSASTPSASQTGNAAMSLRRGSNVELICIALGSFFISFLAGHWSIS